MVCKNEPATQVLLTGAEGFLGRIIYTTSKEKFRITTLSRSTDNPICCDLSTQTFRPNKRFAVVIHCAGRAHSIPYTTQEEEAFFQDNVEGTKNLLRSLLAFGSLPSLFIFTSSVAVYGLQEGELIDEEHPTNPQTPYARSKALAEKAVRDWCEQNSVNWIILRLPLVVGPNPPGNLGTLRKAIGQRKYFRIVGNPARKSMVLAEDIGRLVPHLKGKNGIFHLTDGVHPSFAEVEDAIAHALHKGIPLSLPNGLARMIGKLGDGINSLSFSFPLTAERLHKIKATLTFSDEKARRELGWRPRPVIPYIREGGLEH